MAPPASLRPCPLEAECFCQRDRSGISASLDKARQNPGRPSMFLSGILGRAHCPPLFPR